MSEIQEAVDGEVESTPKTGALFIDLEGCQLTSDEIDLLGDPRVSGVIFFARNFECPQQIADLAAGVRAVRPDLILSVDQEGGRVQRFQSGLSRLPSFSRLAEAGAEACEDLAWLMASEMMSLGLDLSFTPVLDINYGRNQVIGDRAFGSNAAAVIQCGESYLKGLARAGMAATGKHFPGHGWVELDSHFEMPIDEREFEAIQSTDLTVFKHLQGHLAAVMTAHILYEKFDTTIATYSKKWLDVLRNQVGFTGLVVSDDLAMAGATGIGSVCERATAALDAGCNLLLMCNNRQAVLELLESDGQWYTAKSISTLLGRKVLDFAGLVADPEYQRIRQRWGMLLGDALPV